jgi:hypothetical protein
VTPCNYHLDLEDEDLEKAIKASIQTAIQEGISVLLPCDSFGGNVLLIDISFRFHLHMLKMFSVSKNQRNNIEVRKLFVFFTK